MIETIKNIFTKQKNKKDLYATAMRLHYNYFRQMINRTSDGYYTIDGFKDKIREKLLNIYLESKIKEDYGR